jgi:TonB family protein
MRSRVALILIAAFILPGVNLVRAADKPAKSEKFDRAAMIYKPRIEYPYEARRAKITGCGVVGLEVDPATGLVRNAFMKQSTGAGILDRATTDAFRRARFKPGGEPKIKIPICFTVTRLGGNVTLDYQVKQKPMDEALAHFLGKGTVLNGPIPAYPKSPPWTWKQGKGVYELHVGPEGKVAEVKILKSSGDSTFDRVAVATLHKWRLRKGPLILQLPLEFHLTPLKYAVDIPKDR